MIESPEIWEFVGVAACHRFMREGLGMGELRSRSARRYGGSARGSSWWHGDGGVVTSASREGAFRLLESPNVPSATVSEVLHLATAARCSPCALTYVAVDGSSLTLTDRCERRELGRVGGRYAPSRGLHVMTSLAMDSSGAAIGFLDQRWWVRDQPPRPKERNPTKCSRASRANA